MTERIKILNERLEEAFGQLPVPAPETIVYDSSGEHLECLQVAEVFRGRHWLDINTDELMRERDALAFFSPEGFRFYLPAFARFALLDFDEADLIPMVIVWSLGRFEDYARRRIALFDNAQRAVLADCVAFIAEQAPDDFTPEEIDRAISNLKQDTP
jgi:hypothetical protein